MSDSSGESSIDEIIDDEWRYVKPDVNFNLLGQRRAEMINAIVQQETGM